MTGRRLQERAARWTWPLAAALVLAIAGVVAWRQSAQGPSNTMVSTDPQVLARGHEVYEQHCASCHGQNLEGQADWRTRLPSGRLPAPPHDESGHTWHHPGEQLFTIVKHGVQAYAPAGYQSDMPAYDGVLSDAEIWAVLAYIRSTWPADIQRKHDSIERANRRG